MENSQPPPQNEAPQVGQGYLYIVAVLLLTVIGSLAYLWFAERNARVSCQVQMGDQVARLAKANRSMMDIFSKGESQYVAPAQTEEKSAMEATVDGRRRNVIAIDETVGRRLGFAGGDVILVKKVPTTAATAPGAETR
jgi:hypothetical protein